MEELLKEILSRDKSILARRDDLIKILDEEVPNNQRRTYAAFRKALTLNVGEIFLLSDLTSEEKQNRARQILKESGMQDTRINDVINIFANALNLNVPQKVFIEEPPAKVNLEKNLPATPKVNLEKNIPATPTVNETETEIEQEQEPAKSISSQDIFLRIKQRQSAAQNSQAEENPVEEEPVEIVSPRRKYSQENFTNWNLPPNHLDKIFTTEGRLNRWNFFTKSLKILALYVVGSICTGIFAPVGAIMLLAAFIGNIMLMVRRLHDLDKSGWWNLIILIPYVDIIFGLYLTFAKGTDGDNKYGQDPLN